MNFYTQEKWVDWVDRLSEDGYVVIDQFLPDHLYQQLWGFLQHKLEEDEFSKAGIGALGNNKIVSSIRGDFTYWLNHETDRGLADFFELADQVRAQLNRLCFLSLSGYEFHLAHYPQGSFYKKHLDQFNERSNRMISMIVYLNPNWQAGDGGELKIYKEDGQELLVSPIGNRCVMFRSADVPHEVLPTKKSRYSLTGWMLYQPAGVGYLLS